MAVDKASRADAATDKQSGKGAGSQGQPPTGFDQYVSPLKAGVANPSPGSLERPRTDPPVPVIQLGGGGGGVSTVKGDGGGSASPGGSADSSGSGSSSGAGIAKDAGGKGTPNPVDAVATAPTDVAGAVDGGASHAPAGGASLILAGATPVSDTGAEATAASQDRGGSGATAADGTGNADAATRAKDTPDNTHATDRTGTTFRVADIGGVSGNVVQIGHDGHTYHVGVSRTSDAGVTTITIGTGNRSEDATVRLPDSMARDTRITIRESSVPGKVAEIEVSAGRPIIDATGSDAFTVKLATPFGPPSPELKPDTQPHTSRPPADQPRQHHSHQVAPGSGGESAAPNDPTTATAQTIPDGARVTTTGGGEPTRTGPTGVHPTAPEQGTQPHKGTPESAVPVGEQSDAPKTAGERLPAAVNAWSGIGIEDVVAERLPPTSGWVPGHDISTPDKSYALKPQIVQTPDGPQVLYYNAWDRRNHRVDFAVGPGDVDAFIDGCKNQLLGVNQWRIVAGNYFGFTGSNTEWQRQSAMVTDSAMRGDGRSSHAHLGRAWKEALKDPGWWLYLLDGIRAPGPATRLKGTASKTTEAAAHGARPPASVSRTTTHVDNAGTLPTRAEAKAPRSAEIRPAPPTEHRSAPPSDAKVSPTPQGERVSQKDARSRHEGGEAARAQKAHGHSEVHRGPLAGGTRAAEVGSTVKGAASEGARAAGSTDTRAASKSISDQAGAALGGAAGGAGKKAGQAATRGGEAAVRKGGTNVERRAGSVGRDARQPQSPNVESRTGKVRSQPGPAGKRTGQPPMSPERRKHVVKTAGAREKSPESKAIATHEKKVGTGVTRHRHRVSGEKHVGRAGLDRVHDYSKKIEHVLRPHGGKDNVKLGGKPGDFNAGHAEKQHPPNHPVRVDKPMCSDCIGFKQKSAFYEEQPQVVHDPTITRVFHPDGSVTYRALNGVDMYTLPKSHVY